MNLKWGRSAASGGREGLGFGMVLLVGWGGGRATIGGGEGGLDRIEWGLKEPVA